MFRTEEKFSISVDRPTRSIVTFIRKFCITGDENFFFLNFKQLFFILKLGRDDDLTRIDLINFVETIFSLSERGI